MDILKYSKDVLLEKSLRHARELVDRLESGAPEVEQDTPFRVFGRRWRPNEGKVQCFIGGCIGIIQRHRKSCTLYWDSRINLTWPPLDARVPYITDVRLCEGSGQRDLDGTKVKKYCWTEFHRQYSLGSVLRKVALIVLLVLILEDK